MSFLQPQNTHLPSHHHQNGHAHPNGDGSSSRGGRGRGHKNSNSVEADADSSTAGLVAPLLYLLKKPTATIAAAASGILEFRENERRRQLASARLNNAVTYADWQKAAIELDLLEGNEKWKQDPCSPDYDYLLLQARLKELDETRLSCDVGRILFMIRTTLSRNLGDMGNLRLYKHSHTGTKHLIEKYIDSCLATLNSLLTTSLHTRNDNSPTNRQILESLLATRQSFGRTALLLSGGATFGMNHIGVLKALLEADLLPRIISGASAGSIVAAVLCTRTDDEMPIILKEFPYGNMNVFQDSKRPETMIQRLARFLKIGAFIDIKHLISVMQEFLGEITFQEAYNRTRRVLNICVSSASVYELPRLLNYISAPNVLVWSAVAASCSVPFLFSTATLLAKDPKTGLPVPWNPSPQRWIDGSVDNDLPMTRLAEMFNVNHFIVSQVNPHVVPFLEKEENLMNGEVASHDPDKSSSGWTGTITKLALGEALHRMNVLAEMGVFRTGFTKVRSVLSQKYSGDITILPEVTFMDLPLILTNPSTSFLFTATLRGEKATWPRLSRIRNHCAIELALDSAIHQLRTRVVFSPSQTDLRLLGSVSVGGSSLKMSSLLEGNQGTSSRGRRAGNRRRRMRSNGPNEVATAAKFSTDGDLTLSRSRSSTTTTAAGDIKDQPSGRSSSRVSSFSSADTLTDPFADELTNGILHLGSKGSGRRTPIELEPSDSEGFPFLRPSSHKPRTPKPNLKSTTTYFDFDLDPTTTYTTAGPSNAVGASESSSSSSSFSSDDDEVENVKVKDNILATITNTAATHHPTIHPKKQQKQQQQQELHQQQQEQQEQEAQQHKRDVSGTRGMMQRRKSSSNAREWTRMTKMDGGGPGVEGEENGGTLSRKVGLGRAKSAEELRM